LNENLEFSGKTLFLTAWMETFGVPIGTADRATRTTTVGDALDEV
jgi:hypothetical protein